MALTGEIVRHLRQLQKEKRLNVREAARVHGVAAETIRRALRGETWNGLDAGIELSEADWQAEARRSEERLKQMLEEAKEKPAMVEQLLNELNNTGEVV